MTARASSCCRSSSNSSPVDLDLVNNVMRLPYRERFAILLSELGTGLAGRGEELNEVIHRANPALRETEDVVLILARQNRALARLARDSDEALAPLARERRRVSNWIVHGERRPARPPPSGARTSAAASACCPPSCASCGR